MVWLLIANLFFPTQLVAGKYGLEVLVYDGKGNYGRDDVNITVRPSNQYTKPIPPVIIILIRAPC